MAVYSKELGPMVQEDVDLICDLLDGLIYDFGKGKK